MRRSGEEANGKLIENSINVIRTCKCCKKNPGIFEWLTGRRMAWGMQSRCVYVFVCVCGVFAYKYHQRNDCLMASFGSWLCWRRFYEWIIRHSLNTLPLLPATFAVVVIAVVVFIQLKQQLVVQVAHRALAFP